MKNGAYSGAAIFAFCHNNIPTDVVGDFSALNFVEALSCNYATHDDNFVGSGRINNMLASDSR